MKVLRDIVKTQRWIQSKRTSGRKIILVPTMGALHVGHLSLVQKARSLAGPKGIVAVSIFVNPAQFGPREDFKKYPRNFKRDSRMCANAGVDFLFCPTSTAMYPDHFSTWVDEKLRSQGLCGASRPGHFRGVCTVVAKLFNILQPDAAIFGRKDFQQAQVIRKMVLDLNFPIQVIIAPTLREKSGLAFSSRNQYLTTDARDTAARIYAALREAQRAVAKRSVGSSSIAKKIRSRLSGFKIDYISVVDAGTLKPLKRAQKGNCIALAVYLDKVRLIDNIIL